MSLIIPLTFLLFIISFASVGIYCFILLFYKDAPFFQCNLEHDGSITVQIFHSFDFSDNAIFKERGNISIPSLRIGQANVQQNSLSLDDKKKLRVHFLLFTSLTVSHVIVIDYVTAFIIYWKYSLSLLHIGRVHITKFLKVVICTRIHYIM